MDNSTSNMSELLVRYLDGELSGTEKENLEQQLATDNSLQEELESLKTAREAVKQFGLHHTVTGIHREMMKEMQLPVRKMNTTRRIIRYSIAVAASIILAVGGIMVYHIFTLSSNRIFASNYRSYELGTLRDGGTHETPVEKAYREKNYKEVVALTEKSQVAREESFLSAMSYLELNNNTMAIERFKRVLFLNQEDKSGLWKDEAEYYLALTYVRNKDFDLALELLYKMQGNPTHLYNQKITRKLIRQVKLLKWR